jgi:hypothetical protein
LAEFGTGEISQTKKDQLPRRMASFVLKYGEFARNQSVDSLLERSNLSSPARLALDTFKSQSDSQARFRILKELTKLSGKELTMEDRAFTNFQFDVALDERAVNALLEYFAGIGETDQRDRSIAELRKNIGNDGYVYRSNVTSALFEALQTLNMKIALREAGALVEPNTVETTNVESNAGAPNSAWTVNGDTDSFEPGST